LKIFISASFTIDIAVDNMNLRRAVYETNNADGSRKYIPWQLEVMVEYGDSTSFSTTVRQIEGHKRLFERLRLDICFIPLVLARNDNTY
jgi:hypothetical protein